MTWKHRIFVKNATRQHLEARPVGTDPAPPHRAHVAAQDIGAQSEGTIEPDGFNPVFYLPAVQNPSKPNGVFLGLALSDDPPVTSTSCCDTTRLRGRRGRIPRSSPPPSRSRSSR